MNVTYMAQIRKMQQMRHVDCYRHCNLCHQKCFQQCTKYSDMSSRSEAGKLFHAVGPLTAKAVYLSYFLVYKIKTKIAHVTCRTAGLIRP